MALTKFEKDMKIVAKLDDEPNDVGGLTPAELKEKFDEGGEALQTYLNTVLLPELEAAGVPAIVRSGDLTALKYLRLNGDRVLETSADGRTWAHVLPSAEVSSTRSPFSRRYLSAVKSPLRTIAGTPAASSSGRSTVFR